MNGRLEENTAQAQEVIIHLTMESISRGKSSIKVYCDEHGVPNYLDWICFCSYRKTEVHDGTPVHEIIYPHSKLMIVDDRHTIIGSSNINDRNRLIIYFIISYTKKGRIGGEFTVSKCGNVFFFSESVPNLKTTYYFKSEKWF